ncbi:MAG TPA: protein kinase [Polyangia bacterium]|nr:protein kinase [Polyangia bacterium]
MPSAERWRIGKYTILRRIATGGMAELLLARADGPAGFAKLVALKQILPGHADNRGFVEMFLDEARVAARLNHPNIVQIFELGQSDGAYFIAMEYIHGHTVFELLRAGSHRGERVPLDVALGIAIAACDGLGFAHGQRADDGRPLELIHRDVSPQNLLVSYDGAVKLVDFGIARAADQLHHTTYGQVKGKPSYMSPEQAVGGRVDHRTDIYALGVVLHELLTGRRLFGGRALGAPTAEARQAIAPPSQAAPELPRELDAITLRALAYHPGDRFASCEELRAELERVMVRAGLVNSSSRRAELLASWFPGDAERPVIRAGDPPVEPSAGPPRGAASAPIASGLPFDVEDDETPTPTPITPPAADTALTLAPLASPIPSPMTSTPSAETRLGAQPAAPSIDHAAATAFIAAPPSDSAARSFTGVETPTPLVDHAAATAFIAAPAGSPSSPPPVDHAAATAFIAAPAIDARAEETAPFAKAPPRAAATVESTAPTPTPTRSGAGGAHAERRRRRLLRAGAAAAALSLAGAIWLGRALSTRSAPALDPTVGSAGSALAPITREPLNVVFDDDDPPARAASGTLTLDTAPYVDAFLGTRALGRTPLRAVRLPAGRHRVHLVDRDLGIDTITEIEIAGGRATHEHLVFSTGILRVDVPAGTEVQIDGRPSAPAPLAPLSLFEGTHDVVLTWRPKAGPARRRHERVIVRANEEQVLVRDLSRD